MAPSPTGDLHVGGARTALFTWLFARHHDGDFILRIEDTDQKRFVDESLDGIIEVMHWLGLDWDEGPEVGGPYGPYIQSQRLPLYQEHAKWLVEHGHAYPCFCSPERLKQVNEEQRKRGEPPGYDRHCRNLTPEQVAEYTAQGIVPVIRLKVPETGVTVVPDLIRGNIEFENRVLQDAVLLKSDGFPTYHLAVVVDDHLMEISHVTRAEEWIPSSPMHVLLYQAFGWEPPIFAHLPVILRPDGKGKLSKRDGAVGVLEYKRKGYLPEAMNNYLALLGWSSGDEEMFSREDLIEKFDLADVHPSPARFSFDKLLWMNQKYINHVLTLDDFATRSVPFLQAAGLVTDAASDPASPEFAYVKEAVALVKDRARTLEEVVEDTDFFFMDTLPDYDPDSLIPRKDHPEEVEEVLKMVVAVIEASDLNDEDDIEQKLRELAKTYDLKAGQLFMPIRVAVTGRTISPGLFGTLRVLGKERALERLNLAIEKVHAYVAQGNVARYVPPHAHPGMWRPH
jgi:glutamyl-tRNA synthetase